MKKMGFANFREAVNKEFGLHLSYEECEPFWYDYLYAAYPDQVDDVLCSIYNYFVRGD